MRDQSLRNHVANLEQQGELIRITKEADPHQNVSAIGWKAYDRLGKSTLFTNLKGFPGWELVNQVITDRRKWSIALGIDDEEDFIPTLVDRVKRQLKPVDVSAADAMAADTADCVRKVRASLARLSNELSQLRECVVEAEDHRAGQAASLGERLDAVVPPAPLLALGT